jgi:hypothetical protein
MENLSKFFERSTIMFADPQSITVNAVAQSMPRVETSTRKSIYQKNDQTFTLTISHQTGKDQRIRHLARFDQRAIVTNPLDNTKQDYDTLTFYVVIDRPSYGFSMTQTEQLIAGFKTWLDNTCIDKLFGQES